MIIWDDHHRDHLIGQLTMLEEDDGDLLKCGVGEVEVARGFAATITNNNNSDNNNNKNIDAMMLRM